MKNNNFETFVGFLVIIVAALFLLISSKIFSTKDGIGDNYKIKAEFTNIEGINIGSEVKISGVKIGSVSNIELNKENYKSVLTLKMPKNILIPLDSLFKISTSGLIGNKFINVKIGADEEFLTSGDFAEFTESSMDLEDLISRFVFNSEKKDNNE